MRLKTVTLWLLLMFLWVVTPTAMNQLRANVAAVSVLGPLTSRFLSNPLEPAIFVQGSGRTIREHSISSHDVTKDDLRMAEKLVELGRLRLAGSFLVLANYPYDAISVLQNSREDVVAVFMLASAYARIGHLDESWELLQKLPGIYRYLLEGSRWYRELGKIDTAVGLLEMAADLSPPEIARREAIYETLSKTWYQQLGNHELGWHWALKWREAEPFNLRAATWLGLLYIWDHQPEEARAVWLSVEEAMPVDFCPYYYQMGQIQTQEGDIGLAIESYQKAWQCDSSVPIVAWELGRLLQQTGDIAKTRDLFHFVLQYSQDEPLKAQARKALDDLAP